MRISLVAVYGVGVPDVATYQSEPPTFRLGTTDLTEAEYRELSGRGEASDVESRDGVVRLKVGADSVCRLFDCKYEVLFGVPLSRAELTDSDMLTISPALAAAAADEFKTLAEKYGVSGDPCLHLWFDFT